MDENTKATYPLINTQLAYPDLQQQPGYPVIQQPGQQSQNTTTVIVQQPQQYVPKRDWTNPLCACCEQCDICCCVTFCSWFHLCYMYTEYGENCCAACWQGHMIPLINLRIQHRNRFRIQGDICGDTCVPLWCAPCVQCQLASDMRRVKLEKGSLLD